MTYRTIVDLLYMKFRFGFFRDEVHTQMLVYDVATQKLYSTNLGRLELLDPPNLADLAWVRDEPETKIENEICTNIVTDKVENLHHHLDDIDFAEIATWIAFSRPEAREKFRTRPHGKLVKEDPSERGIYSLYLKRGGMKTFEEFCAGLRIFYAMTAYAFTENETTKTVTSWDRSTSFANWAKFAGKKEARRYFEAVDSYSAYS